MSEPSVPSGVERSGKDGAVGTWVWEADGEVLNVVLLYGLHAVIDGIEEVREVFGRLGRVHHGALHIV